MPNYDNGQLFKLNLLIWSHVANYDLYFDNSIHVSPFRVCSGVNQIARLAIKLKRVILLLHLPAIKGPSHNVKLFPPRSP